MALLLVLAGLDLALTFESARRGTWSAPGMSPGVPLSLDLALVVLAAALGLAALWWVRGRAAALLPSALGATRERQAGAVLAAGLVLPLGRTDVLPGEPGGHPGQHGLRAPARASGGGLDPGPARGPRAPGQDRTGVAAVQASQQGHAGRLGRDGDPRAPRRRQPQRRLPTWAPMSTRSPPAGTNGG